MGCVQDGDLRLRVFEPSDAQALQSLLAEPEVLRWWPDSAYQGDRGWVLEINGLLSGWLEYAEQDDEWYPSVSLDIALTSSIHGHGYGRRALRLALEHFTAKGHHRFTIDPVLENERAIRCYKAVGFEPVGVLRSYERNPAGGWNDALLMDLIVEPAGDRGR
jgi:aminoglycoside 6'-N-acetyltransferase